MSRKRQNATKKKKATWFLQPLSVQQRFSVDADATCKGL